MTLAKSFLNLGANGWKIYCLLSCHHDSQFAKIVDVHLCQDRQVKAFFHSVIMVFCCTLKKSIVQIFALLI